MQMNMKSYRRALRSYADAVPSMSDVKEHLPEWKDVRERLPEMPEVSNRSMAKGLGWVSIAIGLSEILAPRKIEQTMGIGNGQAERANGLILQGLKARIFDPIEKYGSKWIQELPRVVWGLRTQRSRATGYSPFFMVYGSEAILPTDIAFGAPHTQNYDEGEAKTTRRTDLDSAEEHRLTAALQHTRYEQQLRRYHDKNVQQRDFNVGNLVL